MILTNRPLLTTLFTLGLLTNIVPTTSNGFGQEAASNETTVAVDAPELTEEAKQAIERGLQFLITSQNQDGSWSTSGSDDYAIAGTSLGLMAFMVEGHFPGFGRFGAALDLSLIHI